MRFNGSVQGLSIVSDTGTPAALCEKVESGSLAIGQNIIENFGIGNRRQTRWGTISAALDFTCTGMAKTTLAKWFPTAKGTQVADFPAASSGFLVEADDGSNGIECLLHDCQPAGCTLTMDQGETAQLMAACQVMSASPDSQAVYTDEPVYTGYSGHTINDCTAQIDSADAGVLSFSLSNGLGVVMSNPMNTKASGVKRLPGGYYINAFAPEFSFDTEEDYNFADLFDDDTPAGVDITLAFANGTGAEDFTITLDSWIPSEWNMPLEPLGLVGFRHVWRPASGTIFNRVQIA